MTGHGWDLRNVEVEARLERDVGVVLVRLVVLVGGLPRRRVLREAFSGLYAALQRQRGDVVRSLEPFMGVEHRRTLAV